MKSFEENLMEQISVIVKRCGEYILHADRSHVGVSSKSGRANFVTTYDKQVQEILKEELMKILPEAHFAGEESEIQEGIDDGYAFIVDPIDGTTNFIKDYHGSAISVGVSQDGEPQIGVIYNPYLDELFYAAKNKGAFLNGKPIHVSKEPLNNGIVLFGTSPYYEELSRQSFDMAYTYFQKALDIRRSGSAAIDLCSIAAGRAEVYFELHLSPWDYAAGAVIVTEAGGRITQIDGSKITLGQGCSILASNGIASL